LKKNVKPPDFECEYLVGDDSCQAVKEGDMGTLRTEACRNEVKDACCYSCTLCDDCSISCDLPELQKPETEAGNSRPPETAGLSEAFSGMSCGDCEYYLRPKCPRSYSSDTELWRRQDTCESFQSSRKQSSER
jgi:hypothetical protein